MTITLSGIVRGRRIDLEEETPIPDGSSVTVRIDARSLTTEEKRRVVAETAGTWTADPSISAIFTEIAARRREILPRSGE